MTRSFKRLAKAAVLTMLAVAALLAGLLIFGLQRTPSVATALSLTPDELAHIEQLVVDSAPGNVRSAQLRQLSLTGNELNLLLRYAVQLVGGDAGIGSVVQLPGELLRAEVSVPLPDQFSRVYLNLAAEFVSEGDRLSLVSLRLGSIPIPSRLVNLLAAQLETHYLATKPAYREVIALLESVKGISLAPDRLDVDFLWEPELIGAIRDQAQRLLVTDSDQRRIARFYGYLTEVVAQLPDSTRAIPLSALLTPLFSRALQLSSQGSDPVADNRAILLTLAAYVNGEPIDQWLDAELAAQLPPPRAIEVRIHRRQDLAQHVAASAAIAASAGAGVAQMLSGIKEKYDARYRSGFSFSDLTANTAGMLLGTLATRSAESAEEMQRRLSAMADDADYLPVLGDSADGMTETDFSARYRNDNSVEYQRRIGDIENRIRQLPVFQGFEQL